MPNWSKFRAIPRLSLDPIEFTQFQTVTFLRVNNLLSLLTNFIPNLHLGTNNQFLIQELVARIKGLELTEKQGRDRKCMERMAFGD